MAGGDLSVSLGVVIGGRVVGAMEGSEATVTSPGAILGSSGRMSSFTKAPLRWAPSTVPPGVSGSGSDSAIPSASPPQSLTLTDPRLQWGPAVAGSPPLPCRAQQDGLLQVVRPPPGPAPGTS